MTSGVDSGPNAYKEMQVTSDKIAAATNLEQDSEAATSIANFQTQAQRALPSSKAPPKKTTKELTGTVQEVSKSEEDAEASKTKQTDKDTQEKANQFQKDNPELNAKSLILLRSSIRNKDTPKEILEKVRKAYPDVSLADEVLDFLLKTTPPDEDLHAKVKQAKEELNLTSGREIVAGRNIHEEARAASEKGLGTPTDLRQMYREITGNPRDANILFIELNTKYSYNDMVKVTNFLLHSMGADLKKGPSISKGEMHNILKEVRTIQAILQVYRFFHKRADLVHSMMKKEGLTVPKELNFENLSKVFMGLVAERYINPDKIRQTAGRLGVTDSVPGQIVAFSQLRDAVRQVSVQLIYRSLEHRDDVYTAIIGALEELEEEYDESFELEEDSDAMEVDQVDSVDMNEEPMDIGEPGDMR